MSDVVERGQTRPGRQPETKKNVREDLTLEPHVCRRCFGRILSAEHSSGQREYICSNCGLSAIGDSPSAICSCGMTLRKTTVTRVKGAKPQDAGIRCIPNPNIGPDFPSEFVAAYVGENTKT